MMESLVTPGVAIIEKKTAELKVDTAAWSVYLVGTKEQQGPLRNLFSTDDSAPTWGRYNEPLQVPWERRELKKQLLALAANPKLFRKNQEDQRQPSADREMGAYGYSDFTSALHKKMLDKKKLQKELGFTKTEPRRRRN
jgi:hypothetical protein